MVAALKDKFGELNLTYSIGGQISFDVFPKASRTPATTFGWAVAFMNTVSVQLPMFGCKG